MKITQSIQNLRNLKEDYKLIGKYLLKDAFFPPDFLAVAVLNRSLCLLSGFAVLIEARNLVAAGPFVRLQLDNGLRFYASSLVDSADDFTMKVLEGVPIRNLTDKQGKKLTDRYLVDTLALQQPWITSVYAETSGYVHFSEKHIFNSLRLKGDRGAFEMKISDVDEFVPEELYLEAIGAFTEATKLTLKLVHAWASQKDREEAVKPKSPSGEPSI